MGDIISTALQDVKNTVTDQGANQAFYPNLKGSAGTYRNGFVYFGYESYRNNRREERWVSVDVATGDVTDILAEVGKLVDDAHGVPGTAFDADGFAFMGHSERNNQSRPIEGLRATTTAATAFGFAADFSDHEWQYPSFCGDLAANGWKLAFTARDNLTRLRIRGTATPGGAWDTSGNDQVLVDFGGSARVYGFNLTYRNGRYYVPFIQTDITNVTQSARHVCVVCYDATTGRAETIGGVQQAANNGNLSDFYIQETVGYSFGSYIVGGWPTALWTSDGKYHLFWTEGAFSGGVNGRDVYHAEMDADGSNLTVETIGVSTTNDIESIAAVQLEGGSLNVAYYTEYNGKTGVHLITRQPGSATWSTPVLRLERDPLRPYQSRQISTVRNGPNNACFLVSEYTFSPDIPVGTSQEVLTNAGGVGVWLLGASNPLTINLPRSADPYKQQVIAQADLTQPFATQDDDDSHYNRRKILSFGSTADSNGAQVDQTGKRFVLGTHTLLRKLPGNIDWTFQMDFSFDQYNNPGNYVLWSCYDWSINQRSFSLNVINGAVTLTVSTDGTFDIPGGKTFQLFQWALSPSINQTYQVAVERDGTNLRLYWDGVNVATETGFQSDTFYVSNMSVATGLGGQILANANTSAFGTHLIGKIKRYRWTHKVARFQGAAYVPTTAWDQPDVFV
ncbi:MAG: hypothetical protein AAF183_13055 [Pseudomonadota bacterium]